MVRGREVAGGGCAGTGDGHRSSWKWSYSAGQSQGTVRRCGCFLHQRQVLLMLLIIFV